MTILTSTKIDPATISITTQTAVNSVANYTVKGLNDQKAAIQAQKIADSAQRDLEIAQVDALLAECTKLGIV